MQTITLPEAQSSLPKLVEAMLGGEWFVIPVQDKRIIMRLQAEGEEEPVPLRPPGYFADCHDEESIALENMAACHSPQTLVP
ncbi:MAG: hypothetical protein Q8M07_16115 [Prosthecobacter sp.]|nr:hypothetical protein [Prosthecobacter sp.]